MTDSRDIVIWGIHPVLETLRANPDQIKSISMQGSLSAAKSSEIVRLAEKAGVKLKQVRKINIPGTTEVNHQGVTATIKENYRINFEELLEEVPSLLVALDSINDPHNLGAIIRSAAAAGADAIIIPKNRAAQITGTVVKVAAGSLAYLKICQVTNLADSLSRLKKEGFWVFGAAGEGEQTIYGVDFSEPTCIVIGSEGKGIRPLVRKQCDFLVKIPIKNPINSLNASVAAGIILFEVARQRETIEHEQ